MARRRNPQPDRRQQRSPPLISRKECSFFRVKCVLRVQEVCCIQCKPLALVFSSLCVTANSHFCRILAVVRLNSAKNKEVSHECHSSRMWPVRPPVRGTTVAQSLHCLR